MARALHDVNRVTTLIGIDEATGLVPTNVAVSSSNELLVKLSSDIEIGAVELKDAGTDTRAIINDADTARTTSTDVLVTQVIDAAGAVLSTSALATSAKQLADGHNVTVDNISTNEIYVRGGGTAGSATDGEVVAVQGIASGTALAVTESTPLTGFATSALQLADGHNVTVDNAVGAGVYVRPGTSAVFTVDLAGNNDVTVTSGNIGHDITGIVDGVTVVTTAGTDVVLAGSTACKRVIIQAMDTNTGIIAVGGAGVDGTSGTGTGVILYPGDAIDFEIDNLADVYIDATVNGEKARYTYFT